MPPSKLPPPKGKCYHCAKPTAAGLRFCPGRSCQRIYYYRQQHPEVQRAQKHDTRRVQATAHRISDAQIEENIRRIAARAVERPEWHLREYKQTKPEPRAWQQELF
jgi:hypothetical protein